MRRLVALAGVLATLASAPAAAAYCRSAVCPDGKEGVTCPNGESQQCDTALQWAQPCIGFAIEQSGSSQVRRVDAEHILVDAFATWTFASCGGGTPSIQVFDLGAVSCDRVEYNQHAGNANILMFHDDAWPYTDDGSTDTIALTTVTFDTADGEIFDADIEVNSANYNFSTTDFPTAGQTDLASVLTHEAGHFLGMAHTLTDPNSTMTPTYDGGTGLRSLDPDDVAGICAAYPPNRDTLGACTGLPRHGFSPECANDQTEGNCAYRPGTPRGVAWPALAAGALALAVARARRRFKART